MPPGGAKLNEDVVIRRAGASDLSTLAAVEQACFGSGALPAISLGQYLELFPSTFLIASSDAECLGLVIGGASAEDPGTAWLLDIAVMPSAQGRGIATRLLGELVMRFRQRDARRVFATVAPDNEASAALLRRAGFVLVRQDASYFGAGEPRDILRLEL
jgi:[ribosomal protein S18]-alanine N-acetyltransferase